MSSQERIDGWTDAQYIIYLESKVRLLEEGARTPFPPTSEAINQSDGEESSSLRHQQQWAAVRYGVNGSCETFPQFSKLPPEIQARIWSCAVSQGLRVRPVEARTYRGWSVWIDARVPVVSQVCQAARNTTLRQYTKLKFWKAHDRGWGPYSQRMSHPCDSHCEVEIDVDFSDTIFLDYAGQTFPFDTLTKLLGSSINKLRSLAINFELCTNDESVYYKLRTLEQLEELIFVASRSGKRPREIRANELVVFKPISEESYADMNPEVYSYYFDPYSVPEFDSLGLPRIDLPPPCPIIRFVDQEVELCPGRRHWTARVEKGRVEEG